MSRDLTSKNAEYTFASPYSQKFSLPGSIIYYITKKPCSSKGYQKLQKTCKYFYSKNHVIIVDEMLDSKTYKWNLLAHKKRYWIQNLFDTTYKIWITSALIIRREKATKLSHKIFRLDVKNLHIHKQDLYLSEVLLFSSSPYLTSVWFLEVNILYQNETMVPIEKIYEIFPANIERFGYRWTKSTAITTKTVETLMLNENFKKIKILTLGRICDKFDFIKFSKFMKEHTTNTDFMLSFCAELPPNYITEIQAFAEWALNIAKSNESYIPPLIRVPNLVSPTLAKLQRFYYARIPR